MLLRGQGLALVFEHFEGVDDLGPRIGRVYHVVYEATTGGDVGIHEEAFVLLNELRPLGLRLVVLADLVAVDDVDRTLGAHHGDLPGGPGVVDVSLQVLAAHGDVRPAVCLADEDADLWHGGLRIGVEELRSVLDYAAVLLDGARHVTRHVDEGDEGNIEGVAESNETRGLG